MFLLHFLEFTHIAELNWKDSFKETQFTSIVLMFCIVHKLCQLNKQRSIVHLLKTIEKSVDVWNAWTQNKYSIARIATQ